MFKGNLIEFYESYNLNTGNFPIFYDFNEQPLINTSPGYSGSYNPTLSSTGNFYLYSGSGFFQGQSLNIPANSGLYSQSFTHLFSFDRSGNHPGCLFSSISGGSGYEIGYTDSNKLYFYTNTGAPLYVTCDLNLFDKNLLAVCYTNNSISFNVYDFIYNQFNTQTFYTNSVIEDSSAWTLGGGRYPISGNMDYYAYFTQAFPALTLQSFAQGCFSSYVTGTGSIITASYQQLTGYGQQYVQTTGFLPSSFTTLGSGDDFQGLGYSITRPTGIVSSGYITVPLYEIITETIVTSVNSGIPFSGYRELFGPKKVCLVDSTYNSSGQIMPVYYYYDETINTGIYNRTTTSFGVVKETYMNDIIPSGYENFYNNGLAILTGIECNVAINQFQVDVTGGLPQDIFIYSKVSGSRPYVYSTGDNNFILSAQANQMYYLNGSYLYSGTDWHSVGGNVQLSSAQLSTISGSGLIFSFPTNGRQLLNGSGVWSGTLFITDSSYVSLSGQKLVQNTDYYELGQYSLFNQSVFQNLTLTGYYTDANNNWSYQ